MIGGRFDRSEKALFKGLVNAGCDLEIIYDPKAPEYALFDGLDVPAEGLSFSSRLDFAAIRFLRAKLGSGRYDIVHSLTNRALSNALFASRGTSVRHICYRGTLGHLSRWDPSSWMTYLNPGVSSIVCVSDAVRRYLKTLGLPETRLKTIYKGHDTDWYKNDGSVLPAEMGIPDGSFVVGYAGGLRPVKGLEYLVESASFLNAESNIHYLVLGEGKLEAKLKKMVSQRGLDGVVHFAGFRTDAASLLGACNAAVMPSVAREGLPRGVIEAMAQGLPVIVTDVGGMPELVSDGECGIVVEPKNARAIADAVNTLAQNRDIVSEYGAAAQKRIATAFNIKDTIEKTLHLYRDVLNVDK